MAGEERQVVISDPIIPELIRARVRLEADTCASAHGYVVGMTPADAAGLSVNLQPDLRENKQMGHRLIDKVCYIAHIYKYP